MNRKITNHTAAQDDIIDRLGATNWQEVVKEFRGKSLATVTKTLDKMFPTEHNAELAQAIVNELK